MARKEGFPLDVLLPLIFEVKELARLIVGKRCSRNKGKVYEGRGNRSRKSLHRRWKGVSL